MSVSDVFDARFTVNLKIKSEENEESASTAMKACLCFLLDGV